ncbi:hypothetical protein TorRG33x02_159970 [Trema orientale]|uniref:Uncharacterized protein n=1 Tax=Trema orientale TaxID=63057 RepID=A0A2P5ERJ6_TREOI|nr:hypothetical protein TorRG33x02_159970 [Trema orientale]
MNETNHRHHLPAAAVDVDSSPFASDNRQVTVSGEKSAVSTASANSDATDPLQKLLATATIPLVVSPNIRALSAMHPNSIVGLRKIDTTSSPVPPNAVPSPTPITQTKGKAVAEKENTAPYLGFKRCTVDVGSASRYVFKRIKATHFSLPENSRIGRGCPATLPRAMNMFSWNARGLGNPSAFNHLCWLVK